MRVHSDSAHAEPRCPACGDPIDYCLGHGEIGDPYGWSLLQLHDQGNHAHCSPMGCDEAPAFGPGYVRDRNKES